MNDRVRLLVTGRRERLARRLGRSLPARAPDPTPLPDAVREHLLEEARELYLNELEWEHITADDMPGAGAPAERTFPAFMAFVRGLLLEQARPDARVPAEPRGAVVEEILRFLGGRVVEIEDRLGGNGDAEEDRLRAELGMTNRLIDLVLFHYHGLSDGGADRVGGARPGA